MLDVFGFPTPQGANYQEFYGGGTVLDWVKPRGASMVRMLLIGAGGGGCGGSGVNGFTGGGSGAVTQWIGPAIFIPDVLRVSIGAGGDGGAAPSGSGSNGVATSIIFQQKDGTGYTLLTANAGNGGTTTGGSGAGGTASSNNFFGAAGIFKSIAGQTGVGQATSITASTTTFLSGGAGGSNQSAAGGNVACNYGYPTINGGSLLGGKGGDGFFLTQPVMIGTGGAGGGGNTAGTGGAGGRGGIGCGGGSGGAGSAGGGAGGRGGDGAVFIWSW